MSLSRGENVSLETGSLTKLHSERLYVLYPYSNISGLNQEGCDRMIMWLRWVKQKYTKNFIEKVSWKVSL
jgi:hypothetical protein